MLSPFFEIQTRLVGSIGGDFKRFLFSGMDWGTRLFAVVGPRGVGKTTMFLQHFRQEYGSPRRCLYLSADHIQVQGLGLYEIAGEFFRTGGELLLIDEVHRYPGWAAEVKSIYDSFPGGRIGLSGSSMLDIIKGGTDLSRRLVVYRLPGLSFREYLALETGLVFDAVSLERLLSEHTEIAAAVIPRTGGTIVDHFRRYLDHGYYPFYLESVDLFHNKLGNVINKVISEDIPSVFGVRPANVPTIRKLVHLVATSQPFTPNIERISAALRISKEYVYQYIDQLRRAGLFIFLDPPGRGLKAVRKPQKIYLDNPNLFPAVLGTVGGRASLGAIREAFFLNQVREVTHLTADARLDFATAEGWRFEVGGRSKGSGQLTGVNGEWLAIDDIEVGSGRRVPLWLFGFLY